MLDELSVYLRKASQIKDAHGQLTAFLTSLFKAVGGAPNAVLVYTLAIGKDGKATDAYSDENQFVARAMEEAKRVDARMAALLNPTEEDETIQVLRRRLFESIDEEAAESVTDAYRQRWNAHKDVLPEVGIRPEASGAFRSSYPLHPEVLETLTSKTATLGNFQRVRGMLRLLARTVAHLWAVKPADATAIHLHHINPGHEPIRQEIVTRLGQSEFTPAIFNDVSARSESKAALAQEIDAEYHEGMPPYASYVARTIFMHTLAFNEPLKGLSVEMLRYSILGPQTDISFIDEACKKFTAESAYLDDRPGVPMRFLAEANLRQLIRRMEDHIDVEEARAELDDQIRKIFDGRSKTLDSVMFPGGPFDVDDNVGDGRPKLVVLGYDALTVGASVESVPELIKRIYERKGLEGSTPRKLRNSLVFVVADAARKKDMRRKAFLRLALREMKKPERLVELAEYQRTEVCEMEMKSEQELAISIQQCYRHVFYPSSNRVGMGNIDLAHTAIDAHSASERPGSGQQQIVRVLRDLKKLRLPEDEPDSPVYVRDRTPLRQGQISTFKLRDEFRRDPALPILSGDDIFVRGVRRGIEQNEYVYQRGKLLCGPGDPQSVIEIDEQSVIFTMAYAKNAGIWPRKPEKDPNGDPGRGQKGGGNGGENDGIITSPRSTSLTSEGVLHEALKHLWEKARAEKLDAIKSLKIRMYEAGDAFRLLGTIGAISGAKRIVAIDVGYDTHDGGKFRGTFRGPVSDACSVREFLEPQLRGAKEKDIQIDFELTFNDGLSLKGDVAKKLTEQISRFASGAESVSVIAEG